MARLSYTEICKERIKEKRNIVISETFDSEGSVTENSFLPQRKKK